MIKFLQRFLLAVTSIIILHQTAFAQNCTINAGVDQIICPGEPFTLTGTASGVFAESATWTQIDGPAVNISVSSVQDGDVTANVSGFAPGNSYTFRLAAKCGDGTPVYNDVVYTTSDITIADAGPSITSCPGTVTMAANAVKPGETGAWVVISGNLPLPSPQTDPNATITLPQSSNIGTTVYRWRVLGSDGCMSQSDMSVTNIGGVSPVTASGPTVNVKCYTTTASAAISGSYAGAAPQQSGTWSFVSGPSAPVFGNVNDNNTTVSNLVGGTYVLRWTVSGQCVNGTADVTIVVDPPSQDVTNAGNSTYTYCDNRTSTGLVGTKPLYTNETVQWVGASGNPPGAVITSPTSPTTTVTGLNGSSNYDFIYTITNSVTNCTSTGTYSIRYLQPPQFTSFPSSPQVLPTDTISYNIIYSVSGGNSTQWQLVSAPPGSRLQDSIGLNTVNPANSTNLYTRGMDSPGTYIFRFRRFNTNASGGCEDAYKDISIVVSRKPYESNAGTSQYLACGVTTATLAGNDPASGDHGTGTWTQVSGPNTAVIADEHLNSTEVSGLISGVYVFRWIVSAGSNVLDNTQSDVQIIVAATPVTANAGPDINTCFGTPVTLNGNQPLNIETGTWSVVSESPAVPASTVTFSDIHDPNAVVSGLLPFKNYTLRWTIENSCGSISDDVVINTSASNGPQQADAGPNQCLPSGTNTFALSANTPGNGETGTWTLLPGAPNTPVYSTTASSQTVSGAINGTYTFEWKLDKNGCVTTRDTVVVTISAPTTAASITGAPLQSICGVTPVTLTGNMPAAGETGTWTQVGGLGGAVITSPNSNVTTVTNLQNGSYNFRWTITNNSCSSSSADITYDISEAPTTANAGPDQGICDVTTATLAATPVVTGTGSWSVISGPGTPTFADISNPVTPVSNLTLGTYVLRWTSVNGVTCPASTDDVSITVGQSANAGPDQNLCNTSTTVLTGNEGSTGTWTQVSGPNNATVTTNSNNTAEVTGMIPGTYVFRYTLTANVCGAPSDETTVIVSGPPSVADAGPDKDLCTSAGNSIDFTAAAPTSGTGVWTIESQPSGATATLSSPNTPTTTLTNITVPGVYLLKWTVSVDNCTGSQSNNDIVRLTVSLPPTTAEAMADQPNDCTGSVVLTGTTPTIGIGTWTFISGPNTPTINAPNSPATTVSNVVVSATPYVFRWTITNGSCTPSSQDVNVTVTDNTPAVADAGTVPDQCTASIGGNATATLASPNVLAGNDMGTWTVVTQPSSSPAVVFSNANSPTATAGSLIAGAYTLRWTVSNTSTCTSFSDVSFIVYDPPSTADAGPSPVSNCLYSPVILAAVAPTSGIGTWTVVSKPAGAPDPVFSSAIAPNTAVTGLVVGNYDFRWTTSNGPCATSQDDVLMTVEDCQIAVSKENPSTPVQQADGSYNVTLIFHVKNTGTVAVSNAQVVDDLNLTFPAPKAFSTVSVSATGSLAANTGFNGSSDTNLLNPASSSLASGAEETITLVMNVLLAQQGSAPVTYSNQNTATAIGSVGTVSVTDVSNNGAVVDKLLADVTPVNFPMVGVSKTAAAPVLKPDGSYDVVYTILVQNFGAINLNSVQLTDNLTTAFTSPLTFAVTGVTGSGTLTVNPGYNGSSDINLLTAASSTLAAGASGTITLSANVVPNAVYGTFNNTTTATGITADASAVTVTDISTNDASPIHSDATKTPLNFTDPTPVVFGPSDIQITKTADNLSPDAGSDVTFTVTAQNLGTGDAAPVVVNDILNTAGFTLVSATPSAGTYDPATGVWSIGTLLVGAANQATLTIVATVLPDKAAGDYVNTASSNHPGDPVASNNSASVTLTPVQVADLRVSNTDNKPVYVPGTTNTYVFVASNAGPSNAAGSNVSFALPAGVSGTWTAVYSGGATGNASGSGAVSETVNLPPLSAVTYTFVTANIPSGQTGPLTTTATVTAPAGVTDLTTANNTADDTDLRVGDADLAITNTDGQSSYSPGVANTYIVVARNNGISDVTGATVTFPLPASLTGTWTAVFAGGASGNASGTNSINELVNMPVGSTVTYTVAATIPSAQSGALTTVASIATPAGAVDPVQSNNSATDIDVQNSISDLGITNTDSKLIYVPGTTNTYVITAGNTGPSDAPGSVITYSLPAGLTGTWTAVYTGGASGSASGSGAINETVNLPAGASVIYTLAVAIPGGQADPAITTVAAIAAAAGITDPTPANNTANDTDTRVGGADLSITITDGKTTYTPGTSTSYTVVATNNGPSDAASATIALPLPAGAVANWTAVFAGGASGAASGNNSINETVQMPAGSSITYTITGAIPGERTGDLSFTANVNLNAGAIDPVPANNTATDTDTQNSEADLAISNTDGKLAYAPGTTNTYTVTARNNGPSNAPGSVVTWSLPAGVTAAWTAVYSGNATGTAGGTNNINELVNLPAGGVVTYTIIASVPSSQTGLFTTQAAIAPAAGINDLTSGNNSATDVDLRSADAELAIVNTDNKPVYTPGTTNTYTVVATNAGPSDVVNANITYTLPTGITGTWSAVYNGGASGNAAGTNNINESVNMPAGSRITYTVTVPVPAGQTGSLFTTVATIATPLGVFDPTSENNTATDNDIRVGDADLAITNTDGQLTYTPGTTTTYTVVATNKGPGDIAAATITYPLPAGVTGSWTAAYAGGSTGNAAGTNSINESVNIPVGSSVTYTINAAIASNVTGPLTTTAGIALPAGSIDPVPADNTASDTDIQNSICDLSISNTDNKLVFVPGTTNTYSVVVTNAGPSDAVGATVKTILPPGTAATWTAAFAGGASGNASGANNISETVNIPLGGSVTYTVIANVPGSQTGAAYTNQATVAPASGVTDPAPANNNANDTDVRVGGADLGITNTDNQLQYIPGTTNSYTVIATNNGPSDVVDANIAYQIPPGTSATWTAVYTGGATGNGNGINAANQLVSMPMGSTITYTVLVNVPANQTGPVITTATISLPAGSVDPIQGNNTASDTDLENSQADLSITNTDGKLNYTPGTTNTYTVVVSNNGPGDSPGSLVTYNLPAGITSTWTAVFEGGATGNAGGSDAISETVNLPAGGKITYTIAVPVPSSQTTAQFTTTAGVTAPNGTNDQTSVNNTAIDIDVLNGSADLAITNTDNKLNYVPGTTNTYTVVATNNGPGDAPASRVTYPLPAGIAGTWTAVYSGGATGAASGTNSIDETPDLPAGSTVTYTIVASVPGSQTGPLTTIATIAGSINDPTPLNNAATDIDTRESQIDLGITNTDGKLVYTPGTANTYTVVVNNTGPSDATASNVTYTLPGGVNTTWTAVYTGGASGNAAGTGNINETVNVPVGGSITYTIVVNVPGNQTGPFTTTASVNGEAGSIEATPDNNTASDTDLKINDFDLSITNDDGKPAYTPGSTNTYTLIAANSGPSDVTGARITYPEIPGVTYAWTAIFTGAASGTAGGTGSIDELVNIPSGTSITYTVIANVSAAKTGDVTTTATIAPPVSFTDPNPANNTASDTDTQSSSADLSITNTDNQTGYIPGTTNTYVVVAMNNGPSDAPGSVITYTLPAGLTATWTAVYAGGSSGAADGTGAITETVNLPAGSSVTYTIAVPVPLNQIPPLTTVASVTPAEAINDPVAGNNVASDTDDRGVKSVISIAATTPAAAEPATNGLFTISSTLPIVEPTTVNYTITGIAINGTDYTTIQNSVSLAPGATSITIPVNVINDEIIEGNETVILTLTGTSNESSVISSVQAETTATVTIADDDVPTQIIANNDNGTVSGYTGGQAVANVLANDVLGVVPATLQNVNLVQGTSADPGVTLDVTTGAVNVVVGTRAGTYRLDYTITDKLNLSNHASAVVIVTVTGLPPIAVDDAINTVSGKPDTIAILANDDAVDPATALDPASVQLKSQPQHGTVVLRADGTVTYTSVKGYVGRDEFTYTVKNTFGYESNVATVRITIEADKLFIPNVITPNGDGKNDAFVIVGIEGYDNADFTVYNRWGNQVYRNANYKNEWTGSDLNQGTYFYILKLNRAAGQELYKGWIEITK